MSLRNLWRRHRSPTPPASSVSIIATLTDANRDHGGDVALVHFVEQAEAYIMERLATDPLPWSVLVEDDRTAMLVTSSGNIFGTFSPASLASLWLERVQELAAGII